MAELIRDENGRIIFTKEMKKDYTILVPNMLPIHFNIMKNVFTNEGYKFALLDNDGTAVKQLGLKYMHNDICYPALLVAGQFLDALSSGKQNRSYDNADRRRLPCLKLHTSFKEGSR